MHVAFRVLLMRKVNVRKNIWRRLKIVSVIVFARKGPRFQSVRIYALKNIDVDYDNLYYTSEKA